MAYEYAEIGTSFDGKPLLMQTGPGPTFMYSMRHVAVWARSERAAVEIQTKYRKAQSA